MPTARSVGLGPAVAFAEIIGGEKSAQQALDDVTPAIQENLDKAWERWDRGQ